MTGKWSQRKLDAGIVSILFVILFCAILATCSSENYYAQQCDAQNQQNNAPKIKNCPSLEFGLATWANNNHDTIEALSALASVIFSVILTFSTAFLWQETRRLARGSEIQIEDMKKSIREAARAAEAMGISADANKRMAIAAERNVQTIIRAESPILYVDSVEIGDHIDSTLDESWIKKVIPTISIRNYGKSPAIVDEVIVNLMVCETLPIEITYQRPTLHPRSFVIQSDLVYKEYLIERTDAFDEDRLASFKKEGFTIFVFGKVTFRNFMDVKNERGFVFMYVKKTKLFVNMQTVYRKYDYQIQHPYWKGYEDNVRAPNTNTLPDAPQ